MKCSCLKVDYKEIEKPVRDFVKALHIKDICTNSSEGGGFGHAAPEFAYVEAYLTKVNLKIIRKNGFLLDKIYNWSRKPLFFRSAIKYGEKTGFYLIGFNRKGLTDKEVSNKSLRIALLLKPQKRHNLSKRKA